MADLVVRHNSCASQVRVIMGDKDFNEREVFGQTYPGATMFICLYHALRTFRREIKTDKLLKKIFFFLNHMCALR